MFTTVAIVVLAALSYASGITAVFRGDYKPSIYSRFVWLLLAVNSFAGVLSLHNNTGSVVLAAVQATGCVGMLVGAWKYSVKTFGIVEWICSALLLASGVVWLTVHSPFVNVLLSLSAHFIGAIPTLLLVRRKPSSENFLFWLFFALASILAFVTADKSHVQNFIYALYFAVFDSAMTVLASRQFVVIEE